MSTDKQSGSSGYTLIELLLVFACLGIASAFSGYLVSDLVQRQSLLKTAQLAADLLAEAKNRSLVYRQSNVIDFQEDQIWMAEHEYSYYGFVKLRNPKLMTYHQNGNINQAITFIFYTKKYQITLTIWLGGGVFEIGKLRYDSY